MTTKRSVAARDAEERTAPSNAFPQSAADMVFRSTSPAKNSQDLPTAPVADDDININRVFPLDGGLI